MVPPEFDSFESTDGEQFVVFHTAQILPVYLLTLTDAPQAFTHRGLIAVSSGGSVLRVRAADHDRSVHKALRAARAAGGAGESLAEAAAQVRTARRDALVAARRKNAGFFFGGRPVLEVAPHDDDDDDDDDDAGLDLLALGGRRLQQEVLDEDDLERDALATMLKTAAGAEHVPVGALPELQAARWAPVTSAEADAQWSMADDSLLFREARIVDRATDVVVGTVSVPAWARAHDASAARAAADTRRAERRHAKAPLEAGTEAARRAARAAPDPTVRAYLAARAATDADVVREARQRARRLGRRGRAARTGSDSDDP
jgi:hypothetical protein